MPWRYGGMPKGPGRPKRDRSKIKAARRQAGS